MPKDARGIIQLVLEDLELNGYDPAFQIAQFLATGEPTFLTPNARKLITSIHRDDLIEELVRNYFNQT